MTPCDRVLSVARRFLRLPDGAFGAVDEYVRLRRVGSKISVCEIFPGCGSSLHEYTSRITRRLGCDDTSDPVWLALSIRIGAIVSAVIDMARANERLDISMVFGDAFAPVSAYLVREMGLPVGNILCCCNENSGFWELLHHGAFRTDRIALRSDIPEADVAVPDGLESLIALCCGREEVMRYIDAVRGGALYVPTEEAFLRLRSVFRAAVVTGDGLLRGAHMHLGVPVGRGTALALAGLLYYRARNGMGRPTLIIAE